MKWAKAQDQALTVVSLAIRYLAKKKEFATVEHSERFSDGTTP